MVLTVFVENNLKINRVPKMGPFYKNLPNISIIVKLRFFWLFCFTLVFTVHVLFFVGTIHVLSIIEVFPKTTPKQNFDRIKMNLENDTRIIQGDPKKGTTEIVFLNFQPGTPRFKIWNDIESTRLTMKHIKKPNCLKKY